MSVIESLWTELGATFIGSFMGGSVSVGTFLATQKRARKKDSVEAAKALHRVLESEWQNAQDAVKSNRQTDAQLAIRSWHTEYLVQRSSIHGKRVVDQARITDGVLRKWAIRPEGNYSATRAEVVSLGNAIRAHVGSRGR
jgi:hypothetical protein